ncbi:MAG TPA: prolyl oligopeptidase family serine peptidase [Bacteroidales bacterium]|nr:prolyl oligopeptidase family serine peptidase [Bacteroidales bacterium]
MKKHAKILVSVLLFSIAVLTVAQKKNLAIDDYAKWQNLGSFTISDNGEWATWHLSLVEGDDTLYIKGLNNGINYKYELSTNPSFSSDSRWLSMQINYSEKESEQMVENKKEIKNKTRLINLETGDIRIFKDIQSSIFSKDGSHLIMSGYPDKTSKTKDIYLFNLTKGTLKNIGNVKEFSVNKKGTKLAYIIEAEGMNGNGVELFDLKNYSVSIIDNDTTAYSDLNWEKEGNGFAFLKAFTDTGFVDKNHVLFAVTDIYSTMNIKKYDPAEMPGIPEGMRIRETYTPVFSKDMSILYFGVYQWTVKENKKDENKEKEKLAGVDIWHWKDDPVQPSQQVTYDRVESNFTYMFAWNPSTNRIVRISDDEFKDPIITGDGKNVLVRSDKAYKPQFRLPHYDHYIINPYTGERTEIIKNFTGLEGSSPGGQFIYYFKDEAWWVYNIGLKKHNNLTSNIDTDFWNIRDDSPKDVKPPFGFGGWLKDDEAFIVYDEYDAWKIYTNGTGPEKLTAGREKEIRCRVLRLDIEENFFDPSDFLYFTVTGDKSKWSGFGSISPKGKYTELIYADKAISGLRKAKNSDKFLFREETYSDSPDVFVTDASFKKPIQISATNLQQNEYYWGKSDLIEYTNRDGKKMQGALYYPSNYETGKQYPMIVYIYEIRSTGVHRYISPSDASAYNTSNYTTGGFFIFQPDIVYKTNHPGESAVDCVVPAVEEVLKTGMIDKDKIGLMGHSWGAYQTSFIITQTDLFSAAVAGAPLIDMISMYNEIYWNSGNPNQNIFETSQGRLREPWWNLMDEYMANSPMFNAGRITTPLLVAFGDKDGAVDWHQGIEMYTTMRRMEKPYIMLVYEGENHGLRKKENMKDYCRKTREFFEHHLLGKDPEEWIVEGKSFMQKKKEENLDK